MIQFSILFEALMVIIEVINASLEISLENQKQY